MGLLHPLHHHRRGNIYHRGRIDDPLHRRSIYLASIWIYHCCWHGMWSLNPKWLYGNPSCFTEGDITHWKCRCNVHSNFRVWSQSFVADNVFSGAIFLAVSQSILSNVLVNDISERIPGIVPARILAAGATGIRDIFPEDLLPLALEAYNSAVRDVFIMGIVLGACSTIASCFIEWKNIKEENRMVDMIWKWEIFYNDINHDERTLSPVM